MRSGGPWNLRGLRPEARAAAREAARRSGMSVGEWLNTVIRPADEDDEEAGGRPMSIASRMSDSSRGPDTTIRSANGIVKPLRPGASAAGRAAAKPRYGMKRATANPVDRSAAAIASRTSRGGKAPRVR